MYVCAFHKRARNLTGLGSGHYRQSVGTQFNAVYTTETAPEKVLMSFVFDVKLVDTVHYADLFTDEKTTMIGKRTFRTFGRGYAYTAG